MNKEQMIQALIDYHEVKAVEAEGMDFMESAKWHDSVSKWLRDEGLSILQRVTDNED